MTLRPHWRNRKPILGASLNRSSLLAQGLVAAYLFNEGNGAIASNAVSPVATRGALESGVAWGATRSGVGTRFDGSATSQIDLGAAALPYISVGSNFTLAFWVQFAASVAYAGMFHLFPTGATNPWIMIMSASDASYGPIIFGPNTASAQVKAGAAGDFNADSVGLWRLWVVVGKNGFASSTPGDYLVYLNGANKTTSAGGSFAATTTVNNHIGWDRSDSRHNGMLDSVMLWNRSLNPAEVNQLYTQPYSMFATASRRSGVQSAAASTALGSYYYRQVAGMGA